MISENLTFIQGNSDILTKFEHTSKLLGKGNNPVWEASEI